MFLNLKGIERIKTSKNPEHAIRNFLYSSTNKPIEPQQQQVLSASIIHCPKKIESLKNICNMFNLGESN